MDGQSPTAWCARQRWPAPADGAAAERLIERLGAGAEPARALAGDAGGRAMLAAIGGNAPYLADLFAREWEAGCAVARDGPEGVVAEALAALERTAPALPQAGVAAALRRAKRVAALAVALADIGGAWRPERVTGALSDLADRALALALGHAVLAAQHAGHLRPAPLAACGVVVLAMGKLGARELNYSSDVDLVLLHDPEAGLGESSSVVFTRIARTVVALLEARDADGYVFRTDLRLRPDPAATPPSVALPAALTYYESLGQTWERAAMLRARPAAGDLRLGAAFLEAIRPFVWRRGLDFAAIADLHAMKQRIDAHRGTRLAPHGDPLDRVAGHDVKLGQGGIREIEFVAQTLQLVWGGRDPWLREPRLLEGLRRLAEAGHLPRRAAGELAVAYRFLRRVEHRLQMVADRQTHALPASAEGVARFACFMGMPSGAAFAERLLTHLRRVSARFADFFARVPGEAAAVPSLEGLGALGFTAPEAALAAFDSWRAGRPRALRSERARRLLDAVLPALVQALARQTQPDAALARFDRLLASLPAGVQPLSLFHRNPGLLGRVVDVLGAAPSLAEHLAGNFAALDGLIAPDAPEPVADRLARRLLDARGLEDCIAIVRRTVREEDFSLSVATLEGRLDADTAGARRSALADAAIAALLPPVLADMARRHGTVPGGDLAVVLLGKAGGREMMAGSDLDLMLVYDHPETTIQSDGKGGDGARPLPASQWFIRAVHGFVAALTAPDAGGALYAVDMRLRPSGNKGPVAVSLGAFERYHAAGGGAWTWERMALTRARVVAGGEVLRGRVAAAIRAALAASDPDRVRADAVAMRARLWRDARPAGAPFALRDSKLRPGGLVECEFVAQALQVLRACETPRPATAAPPGPGTLHPHTGEALRLLARAHALPERDAVLLAEADVVWRTVLGMLRLTQGRAEAEPNGAALAALLRAVGAAGVVAVDLAGLHATLDALAAGVRATFVRQLGPIPGEDGT